MLWCYWMASRQQSTREVNMVHMSGHSCLVTWFCKPQGWVSQVCCLCIFAGATLGISSKMCTDKIPRVAPATHGRVTRKCAGYLEVSLGLNPLKCRKGSRHILEIISILNFLDGLGWECTLSFLSKIFPPWHGMLLKERLFATPPHSHETTNRSVYRNICNYFSSFCNYFSSSTTLRFDNFRRKWFRDLFLFLFLFLLRMISSSKGC